jgi:predicted MFS family arabinose efflux permease
VRPVTPVNPSAPVRDRVSWFLFACLACYGFLLYGLGPALDALRDELDVSRSEIGLAGTALATGGLLTALFGRALLHRTPPVVLLRASLAGMAATLALFFLGFHTVVVVLGGLFAGIAGGVMLLVVPVVIEQTQPAARAALLAEANLGAALAGILAPFAVGAATVAGAGWRTGMALLLVPLVILVIWGRTIAVARPKDDPVEPGTTSRLPRAYWRWWTSLLLAVSVEFCIIFWAIDYLQEEAGLRRGPASAALGLFVVGLALGRLLGGRLAVTRRPPDLLLAALGVVIAGFTFFWWAPSPVAAVGGLLVAGMGVSVLYPLSLSMSMQAAPGQAGAASARAALASGLAILVAPFALAALADTAGVRSAFLIVYGLIAAALLVIVGGRSASTDAR